MKKNYSNYLKKVSHRTLAYLFLTALSVSVLLYSCRKIGAVPNEYAKPPIDIAAVITKNDLLNWYDDLPIEDQNNLNAATGLVSGYGKVPFPLQWEKAQQRILNGKHVVRVPINNTALLVFEKEGNNGPLIAYTYKWQPNTNKGTQYSGDVIRFSFQDYSIAGLQFKKNQRTAAFNFPNARPIDLGQLKSVKELLKTQKTGNKFRINTLKSQSFLGFLGSVLTAIVDVVHAAGCTITNQNYTWSEGNILYNNSSTSEDMKPYVHGECQGQIFDFNVGAKDPNAPVTPPSTDSLSAEVQDNIGGGGFLTIGGSFGGGSSSGGSSSGGDSSGGSSSGSGGSAYNPISNLSTDFWTKFNQMTGGQYTITAPGYTAPPPPQPTITPAQIESAILVLGLNPAQEAWVRGNSSTQWGSDVINYLATQPTAAQKAILVKHIDMMENTANTAYHELVNNYQYYRNVTYAVNPNADIISFEWWDNADWTLFPENWPIAETVFTSLGMQGPALDLGAPHTPPASPTFVYNPTYRAVYPRFSALVDQLPAFLACHSKVLTALVQYTGLTREQVIQLVQPGMGPSIEIVELAERILGHQPNSNVVQINSLWVAQLENFNYSPGYVLQPASEQALAFLLVVGIFHETVHLGRYLKNQPTTLDPLHNKITEAGEAFESVAFKMRVTEYDVGTNKETRDYTFYIPN